MKRFSVIGESVTRLDAVAKVTGEAKYTGDLKIAGMCYAKLVRSPYAHAKIVQINTSEAEKVAGVKAIVTGQDTPDILWGVLTRDQPIIARDVVRFVGEPVAAVVANTMEAAEKAARLINVQYTELPAAFDPEESMSTQPAVILHPRLKDYIRTPSDPDKFRLHPRLPNVFRHRIYCCGEVEKGFREADLILENRYYSSSTQHAGMEPHVAIARWEADGRLVVQSTNQTIHGVKSWLSEYFGMPLIKISVRCAYTGAGFGGSIDHSLETITALLAQKSGRPVCLQYSREETSSIVVRPSTIVYVKDGVKKDGTLVARRLRIIIDGGAYAGGGVDRYILTGPYGAIGSYRIPNLRIDCYGVYTNKAPGRSFRGVECPKVVFAIESQMDMLAEKLGLDAVEIRKRNFLREGDKDASGMITQSIGVSECLEKTAEWIEWQRKPSREPGSPLVKGKGIAVANQFTIGGFAGSATVKVHPDGFIEVRHGGSELGQGINTALAQIAAEEFGISVSQVRVTHGETDTTPFDPWTASSRSTFFVGGAVLRACQDAKRQLFELVAKQLGSTPDQLETKAGKIYAKDAPQKQITISQVFHPLGWCPGVGEILGRGMFNTQVFPQNDDTGQSERYVAYFAHGSHAVEVGVDIETGEVKILRVAGAFDVGQPINPKMCEQQIEGGIGQGIGHALYEEQILNNGVLMNPNFTDYRIPTVNQMPKVGEMQSIIAAVPHKEGPFGAKGFGEAVLSPLAPAIANAVYNAVGIRIRELPITAERVLRALNEKRQEKP